MSHGKLRNDKTCLNCEHEVAERFCPHCGQENVETKQPFYYLFTHFIEDFTHYDGQFWGTIKNLLFKPGKLTQVYLEGKRQKFVPPVKLYIFMSFITFFLFALSPPFTINQHPSKEQNLDPKKTGKVINDEILKNLKNKENLTAEDSIYIQKTVNSLNDLQTINQDYNEKLSDDSAFLGYKTEAEYKKGTKNKSLIFGLLQDSFAHKFFELKEKGVSKKEIFINIIETSFHNLPKGLFIYLPIFAFFLWIFHSKKKWWYFDHGVFTLHYFSFLLLVVLLTTFISKTKALLPDIAFTNTIFNIFYILLTLYTAVYFFISHHRVYKSHGVVSFIIGSLLFALNVIAFSFLLIFLALISFLMIH